MTFTFTQALILTCIIETIILVLFFYREIRIQKLIIASFVVNLITLPIAWIALPLIPLNFLLNFILIEVSVFLAESLMLKVIFEEIQTKRIIIAAFAMNFVTAVIGLLS
ncbi:MAG: hypothetical protein AB1467_00115 [Candidatus Diapherotrites archaeon]